MWTELPKDTLPTVLMKCVYQKGNLLARLVIDVSGSEQGGKKERDKNWLDFMFYF